MLHEHRDIISKLKQEDAHFARMFDKHNALDQKLENEGAHLPDMEAETLKKEKLSLKDSIYTQIMQYKKENKL